MSREVLSYHIYKPIALEVLLTNCLLELVKVIVTVDQDEISQALDERVLVAVLVLLLWKRHQRMLNSDVARGDCSAGLEL